MADETPNIISVTVSVSPQVWLTQYKSLKPHASVTIGIPSGELKDSDLKFAAGHLRRAIFTALKTEIEVLNESYEALPDQAEDTTQLAQLCLKEIGDVTSNPTFKAVVNPVKAPVKKAGGTQDPWTKVTPSGVPPHKAPVVKVPGSALFNASTKPAKGKAADI